MTYIKDIQPGTPTGQDLVAQGDEQFNALKADVKNTLGGLDGPVYEDADIAGDNGSTLLSARIMSSWEARIKALEALATSPDGTSIPVGGIAIWYGTAATIPVGWAKCDGGTHQYRDGNGVLRTITTPDLRGRFVLNPDWTGLSQGQTGGLRYTAGEQNRNTENAGAHTHSVATPGHTLTSGQMPRHGHGMFGGSASISGSNPTPVGFLEYAAVKLTNSNGPFAYTIVKTTTSPGNGATSIAGADQAHTHPTTNSSSAGNHSHSFNATQPFCCLYYICYVAG